MLHNITLGQYFPGESLLHKMDPRAKILGTCVLMVVIFLAQSIPSYAILTGLAVVAFASSKLPMRLIWQSIRPLWVIILFTMAIHIFTTPGVEIWRWHFISITEEGLHQGSLMTARLVYLLLFSSLLTYTTSPIVLTDGIEALLHPFKPLGLPAHELAMMMTIALRFIPTLLEETDRIMKAQTARGADFTSGNILQRAKHMIPILVPLFISAFRRADDLATAMEARCYRGGENRTRMKPLEYSMYDAIGGSVLLIVSASLVYLRFCV